MKREEYEETCVRKSVELIDKRGKGECKFKIMKRKGERVKCISMLKKGLKSWINTSSKGKLKDIRETKRRVWNKTRLESWIIMIKNQRAER